MKKGFFGALFFLILISFTFIILSAGELTYVINSPVIKFGVSNNYTTLSADSFKNLTIPGNPSVLYKPICFLLPPTAVVDRIWIDNVKTTESAIYGKIYPAQKPIPLMQKTPIKFTEPVKSIYESDKEFPGYLIKKIGLSHLGSFKILQVNVYPVQYIPSENRIMNNSFILHISYSEGKSAIKPISALQFENTKKIANSLVVNPEMISRYETTVRR